MSLPASCPLGLLLTQGLWALVPTRKQSGTLALLTEHLRLFPDTRSYNQPSPIICP